VFRLRDTITKMPLLVRVVSLYILSFLILFTVGQLSLYMRDTFNIQNSLPLKASSLTALNVSNMVTRGKPSSLTIERLNVELVIKNGVYNDDTDTWTLSDDAVYYAQMTALPNNQRGNTFLYGHNTDRVLLPLRSLVVGDVASVATTNGHKFNYKYTSDALVPPSLTSVLYDNPKKPRLTIMTCEGVWNSERRLMYFDFVGVE